MSLRLLLDEDSQAKYLVNLLQSAGHDVMTASLAGLINCEDSVVFDRAQQEKRVVLTRNCNDFQMLHQVNSLHSGILAIYQDADVFKNMSYQAIVLAISNIEAAGFSLKNQFVILNQWQF